MTFARIFLWLAAAMSVVAGLVYVVSPLLMTASAGFGELLPGGTTDVRATYGGLQLGLGIFFAWTALDPTRIRSGLVLALLIFGALASCRAVGVVLDASLNEFHRTGLIFETLLTLVALAAVVKIPTPAATR